MTYDRAYSVSTWTRPSVATLLTSRLPAEVGALNRYGRLDDKVAYLPELFQKAGWATAAFVCNGNIFDRRLGFYRGFDRFDAISGPDNDAHALAHFVVDPAVQYIEEQRSPRFFVYVHVVDPHAPIKLGAEYAGLFSDGAAKTTSQREGLLLDYDRGVRQADDQFERLRAALERKGWWRRSTVIYTSDHGEEFLEHGGLGHGTTIYEEQVRIPLLVKYPDQDSGSRRSDSVTLADITPTLASVYGLPKTRRWIGRDLQGPPSRPERSLYFTEDLDDVRTYGLLRQNLKVVVQLYPVFWIRFFDLANDPGEQTGKVLECAGGSTVRESGTMRRLDELRDRDVQAFPAVRVEKAGNQGTMTFEIVAPLAEISKPFLRYQDLCRYADCVRDQQLRVRATLGASDAFSLSVSADDRGRNADLRVNVLSGERVAVVAPGTADGPVRVTRIAAHFLSGPTADEMVLRNLKALGYAQ